MGKQRDVDFRFTWVMFFLTLVVSCASVAGLAFVTEWLSNLLHPYLLLFPGDIVVYLIAMLGTINVTVLLYFTERVAVWDETLQDTGAALGATLAWAGAFIVAFSEFCRHWYLSFGGFVSVNADYFHWIRLGLSWALDTITFNTSQIFDWATTDIQPTTFWTRLYLVLFNVALELAVIGGITRVASLILRTRARKQTNEK
jgi:hypothetical protein